MLVFFAIPALAVKTQLRTATGGEAVSGGNPTFSMPTYSAVNGMGIAPTAPVTTITTGLTNRALYITPIQIGYSATASPNATVVTTANVSSATPFGNAHLDLYICPVPANGAMPTCSAASNYLDVPTTTMTVVPSGLSAAPDYTFYIGVMVDNFSGPGAFTNGSLTGRISFTTIESKPSGPGTTTDTVTLDITVTAMTAIGLTLGAAPSGLPIAAANDFTLNFGNVNGLGIGTPLSGETIVPVSGGTIWATPYLLQPSFTNFSSATGTISVYVLSNFTNTATLALQDSAALTTGYSSISTNSLSPTMIANKTATNGAAITRYLGLLVRAVNAGSGGDQATLRFTLTVP